jgi:hypothetical protein
VAALTTEGDLMGALETITAAATRIITRGKGGSSAGKTNGLQSIAWDMFEQVPEVGTYADWVSNACTGARLFAGKRMPDGTVEPLPDTSRAAELVKSIAGGMDGQAEMLGDFGTNLAVAGEAWLINVPNPDAWTSPSTTRTFSRTRTRPWQSGCGSRRPGSAGWPPARSSARSPCWKNCAC